MARPTFTCFNGFSFIRLPVLSYVLREGVIRVWSTQQSLNTSKEIKQMDHTLPTDRCILLWKDTFLNNITSDCTSAYFCRPSSFYNSIEIKAKNTSKVQFLSEVQGSICPSKCQGIFCQAEIRKTC